MDIDIYVDSVYNGFFPVLIMEDLLNDHRAECASKAENIGEDDVLVYAVFSYEPDSQKIISLNLVCLVMPYSDYVGFVAEQNSGDTFKRFFFMRKIIRKSKGEHNE